MRSSRAGKRDRGFSLLEIILVLAIVVIFAAIATPRYARSLAQYRSQCAANRIVVDLALAAANAKANSAAQTVTFNVVANSYQLVGMSSSERPMATNQVALSAEPYASLFVSCDLGGDASVVFDGYGTPDSGGTIVVRSGDFSRTITVDAGSGRASFK